MNIKYLFSLFITSLLFQAGNSQTVYVLTNPNKVYTKSHDYDLYKVDLSTCQSTYLFSPYPGGFIDYDERAEQILSNNPYSTQKGFGVFDANITPSILYPSVLTPNSLLFDSLKFGGSFTLSPEGHVATAFGPVDSTLHFYDVAGVSSQTPKFNHPIFPGDVAFKQDDFYRIACEVSFGSPPHKNRDGCFVKRYSSNGNYQELGRIKNKVGIHGLTSIGCDGDLVFGADSSLYLLPDSNLLEAKSLCPGVVSGQIRSLASAEELLSMRELYLPETTHLCRQDTLDVSVFLAGNKSQYHWSNGDKTKNTRVFENGILSIEATNECGTFRDTMNIILEDSVRPNLGPDLILCNEDSIELFQRGPISRLMEWNTNETGDSIIVSESNTYTLQMSNECSTDEDEIEVEFANYKNFDFFKDSIICESSNLSLLLDSVDGFQFHWGPDSSTRKIDINESGVYSVTVTFREHCVFEDSMEINFAGLEPFEVLSDTTLCQGDSFVIQIPAPPNASIFVNDRPNKRAFVVSKPGRIRIHSVTEECVQFDHLYVSEADLPFFSLGSDTFICSREEVLLEILGDSYDELMWSTGESNPQIWIQETGEYSARASNICGEWYDEIFIEIAPCYDPLAVPNVITPNLDGKNDEFVLNRTESVEQLEIRIFNRWGSLVFESSDLDFKWTGSNQAGEAVSEGVYFYELTARESNSKETHLEGTVTVLR